MVLTCDQLWNGVDFMFKITKFSLLFLILVYLLGCRSSQTVESSSQLSLSQNIIGFWNLKSVAGESPSKINIKTWQIEFSENGDWKYSGSMTGQYEGMELKGSGTYKTSENIFEYSAGNNNGKSKIEIKDNTLTFSPDPVVKHNGKDDVMTIYERVKQ